VPDLLGSDFGCSRIDKGQAQPHSVAAHTRSLVALLDNIGLGTIDLLGHSFGGFLVQVSKCVHCVHMCIALQYGLNMVIY
jgi:pimeloyl-ACP methyl ester carboxylesterase